MAVIGLHNLIGCCQPLSDFQVPCLGCAMLVVARHRRQWGVQWGRVLFVDRRKALLRALTTRKSEQPNNFITGQCIQCRVMSALAGRGLISRN